MNQVHLGSPSVGRYETASFALKINLLPSERLEHFLHSFRHRCKPVACRVVICNTFPFRIVRNAYMFLLAAMAAFSSVLFFAFRDLGTASWSGIVGSVASAAVDALEIAAATAAGSCTMLLLLIAAKNMHAYFYRERRYHRVANLGVPWTATATRCLADGNHIRHGWTVHGWDVLGAWAKTRPK
ncbi:hypothetical protein [Candidatus Poriferisodalis sp.]|uniref:hypothetical protein n=1 Tax=Candidatus Poriferisodalis sp. TaxID=3101277 RepID=UPI003B0208C8